MTIFDLVFIALFLISIGTLAVAAIFAILGRRARAIGILKGLVIVVAIYCGIVILVSLVAPRRVLTVGEPLCFDDWCITVESADRTTSQSEASYVVRLRLPAAPDARLSARTASSFISPRPTGRATIQFLTHPLRP